MDSSGLRASVVMPTHGRPEQLARVLRPLLDDPATDEVVVVVDGPDVQAEAVLTHLSAADPRVRWEVMDPNVGTSRAQAHGAGVATGEVLVLVDDDVLAGDGLVSRHLEHHRRAESQVVIGSMPVVHCAEGSPLDRLAGAIYSRTYDGSLAAYRNDPSTVLAGLWGGNVSLRRRDYLPLIPALHLFPPLPHEDQHLGLLARAAGLQGVHDPGAAAEHLHRRTWDALMHDSVRQGRGQRALHALHPAVLGSFDAERLPEPLSPLVALAVRHSDRPAMRRGLLGALRLAARASLAVGAEQVALGMAFAATQVSRRVGRRDAEVDHVLAALAAAQAGRP